MVKNDDIWDSKASSILERKEYYLRANETVQNQEFIVDGMHVWFKYLVQTLWSVESWKPLEKNEGLHDKQRKKM